MEGSTCFDSISGCVNNALDLKHTCVNNEQCVYTGSHLVGNNEIAELGNALHETLLVQDTQGPLLRVHPDTVEEAASSQEKGKLCSSFIDQQVELITKRSTKNVSKCATFPCSPKSFDPATLEGTDEMPEMASHECCFQKSGNPTCTRSISLPTPLKLVSAMKGSREKQGVPPKQLTVTWAADVYDPPSTLLSHTVKNHSQQRHRTNKKNSKHKHKKKSSRGSNSDKQQHRKHTGNSATPSNSSAASESVVIGGLHESGMEVMDFSVAGQESKCRSSFFRTTLGRVHMSVTEAT